MLEISVSGRLRKYSKTNLCDLAHAVCGCVCFRVKAVMCHCQCNMFAFLFLSLFLSLFFLLLVALLLISPLCSSGLEASPGPFFYFTSASEEKKDTSAVPLEPLVFQRGSINLSPCKRCKPRATNDLLVYLFQYFRWLV